HYPLQGDSLHVPEAGLFRERVDLAGIWPERPGRTGERVRGRLQQVRLLARGRNDGHARVWYLRPDFGHGNGGSVQLSQWLPASQDHGDVLRGPWHRPGLLVQDL